MSIIQSGHFVQITPISGLFQSDIYSVTSILKQPSLITINIQNIANSSDVKTLVISSNGYVIKGETQKYQLRFESDPSKLQSERTSRQIGTGSPQFAMTGVEPIDINILVQMDDQTLTSACQTDRYISSLCRKDMLWLQKIQLKFPGAEQFKDNTTNSWKDYYIRLNYVVIDQDTTKSEEFNQFAANEEARNGHLDVLKWLATLIPPVYPDKNGANLAALDGHLNILQWMSDLGQPIYPTEYGANDAEYKGHLDILKWMAMLDSPVYPDLDGANLAAGNGQLDVLLWMSRLELPLFPTQGGSIYGDIEEPMGADGAAEGGHLDVLKWMATLNPPIYPGQEGTNNADLDVWKWMASLNPPILPDQEGANNAADSGHLDVLKWMASLNPSVYPTQEGVTDAVSMGQLDVLKWLASLNPPVYPDQEIVDQESVNEAAGEGHLDVLEWLATLNPPIYPDHVGAERAGRNGHIDVMEWLAQEGIYPW